MLYKLRMYSVFALLIYLSLLISCSESPFKKSSYEIYSIIKKSMKLIKTVEAKNVYDKEGNITAVLIEHDNSKAREYLQANESSISKHYQLLKSYTDHPNESYYDAIFILAFFNELFEWISGKPIEDRCLYVKMIPTDKRVRVSEWLLDDILGSYIYDKHTEQHWHTMTYALKYDYILHFLNSLTQQGRKCIEGLEDLEERTRVFPPNAMTE